MLPVRGAGLILGRTNNTSVGASIFKQANATTQVGVELGYNTATSDNAFNIVAKFEHSKTAFTKVSLDKKLNIGLAVTQKLNDSFSLTLASKIDGSNLAADTHTLGASLTFE